MVTVACVLRSGGDFTPEYVYRLRDGVARFCTVPYRFVCLTDIPDQIDCETIKLEQDWPGWWSKMNLFLLTGSVVYFDLDTVINGCIDPIIQHDHGFSMLEDFYHPGIPASGVMAWNGDYRHLFEEFDIGTINNYRTGKCFGDQGYIAGKLEGVDFLQKIMPDGFVVSKKANTTAEREKAAVICYHGQPRPHKTGWAI